MAYDTKYRRGLQALCEKHPRWTLLEDKTQKGYHILEHESAERVYAAATPGKGVSGGLFNAEKKMRIVMRRVGEMK